mmetsp:Transcript_56334/g.167568  ORF Transcript_56334/g.167568 Transcript_56334/m.167568 type:complete len:148 (+) Transcript_56334:463-906(+)
MRFTGSVAHPRFANAGLSNTPSSACRGVHRGVHGAVGGRWPAAAGDFPEVGLGPALVAADLSVDMQDANPSALLVPPAEDLGRGELLGSDLQSRPSHGSASVSAQASSAGRHRGEAWQLATAVLPLTRARGTRPALSSERALVAVPQ